MQVSTRPSASREIPSPPVQSPPELGAAGPSSAGPNVTTPNVTARTAGEATLLHSHTKSPAVALANAIQAKTAAGTGSTTAEEVKAIPLGTAQTSSASQHWLSKLAMMEGSHRAWSNNPSNAHDRGGETNYGLTLDTFKALRPGGTEAQFRSLSLSDVEAIARDLFRFNGSSKIQDPGVAILIADSFWGGWSVDPLNRALQSLGHPKVDNCNILSDQAAKAINSLDPQAFVDAYRRERKTYHERVAEQPNQERFLKGWIRRVDARWIQSKLVSGHPGDAAKWLNGQSLEVLNLQLTWLNPSELRQLHEAALREPGVGPGSRFAQLAVERLGMND